MITVYIASPYTKGAVAKNVADSIAAGNELIKNGFCPFMPLMTHFSHMFFQHDYETYMRMDFEWVSKCDSLIRLPGESSGADREVKHALELGKNVFYSVQEFLDYFNA